MLTCIMVKHLPALMIKVWRLYFFSTDIHFGLLTLAKIGEKKKYFPQLHRKHPQQSWVYGLSTVRQTNPNLEAFKQSTFTECSIADVLILAALAHDLGLWSGHGVLRPYVSHHTLSLFVSSTVPSPPPPPLISSQAQEAAGVHTRGRPLGRMRGRCLHGAALLCPHHWLLTKLLVRLVGIASHPTIE